MAATRQHLLDGRKRPAPAVPVEELGPELPSSAVTCKQEWVDLSPEAEPEPEPAPSAGCCWPWPAAQQSPQVQVHKQSVVRVVHVYAPKVIHTEPHNFRALVHQLTGHTPPPPAAPGLGAAAAADDVNGTARVRVRPAAKRVKLEKKQVVEQVAAPTASDGAGGAAEDDDRSRYRQPQQTLVAGGGAGGGGGLQYPRPQLHQALARYRYRPGPAASAQHGHAHGGRRSLPTLQQFYSRTSAHIPGRRLDMPLDAPVPIAAAGGTTLDQQLPTSVPAASISAGPGVVTLAYPAAAAAVTVVTSSSNSTPTSSPGPGPPGGLVPRPAPTPPPPPYSYCNSYTHSYDDVSSHGVGHQHHHKRLQLRMLQRQDSFTSSANSGPTSAAGTMTYLHRHGQLPEAAAAYPAACDDAMPPVSTTSYQPQQQQQQQRHHHHLAEHQSQQEALGHLFARPGPGPGPGPYYTSSASTAAAAAAAGGLQQQPDYTSSGRSDSGLQMAMGIGGGFQHPQQQHHAGSLYSLLTASGSTSSGSTSCAPAAACVPTATMEQPPGPGDPDALSDTELFLELWGGGSDASLHHLQAPSTQQLCTAFTMPVGAPEQQQQQRQPS